MSIDRTRSDTSNSGERRGSWYPMYSHRIQWILRILIISRIRRFLAGSRIQGSVRIQRIQRIRRIQIGFYENRNDIMKKYMILWKYGEYEQYTEDTGDCVFFSVKVMERDILKHSNWNLDSSFYTIWLGQFHCTHQIDIRKHEKSKIKQTISLLFWTEIYHIR